jgi:hypothetical protein
MAKDLTFILNGTQYVAAPEKVERKKLYGWVDTCVTDDKGGECQLAYLDDSGAIIIPKGGIAQLLLTPDGQWVDKSTLIARQMDGTLAEKVHSSFDAPIKLGAPVPLEDLLDHAITSAYCLQGERASQLAAALGESVFRFIFNYRTDYEGATAFLLNSNGIPFILTGKKVQLEMVGLEQVGQIDELEAEGEEEADELDFSMM